MKANPKFVKLGLIVMVFVLILVGGVVTLNIRKSILKAQSVLGEMDITKVPFITSVAPLSVKVGKEYVYDIKYSDADSSAESISVSLVSAPEWLHMQELEVYGTPQVGSEGQYKFVLRISDGINSSTQTNYVLVENGDAE